MHSDVLCKAVSETGKLQVLLLGTTWDRCYSFGNIFAVKMNLKIGVSTQNTAFLFPN
jgi:hypothetical protein